MKRVKLTCGKYALIDDEDFDRIEKHSWHLVKIGSVFYAATGIWNGSNMTTYYLHRFIMNTPKRLVTDHIDGNGLNNQKSNLRVCTSSQNHMNTGLQKNNTSGYRGVMWYKRDKKWLAVIKIDKKLINLGKYKEKSKAIEIRSKAEKKYYKEFAQK